MPSTADFESRAARAIARYADQMPIDVDAAELVRATGGTRYSPGHPVRTWITRTAAIPSPVRKGSVMPSSVGLPIALVTAFALVTVLVAALTFPRTSSIPAGGGSQPTGSLSVPRVGHSATLLSDGRVLVVGGTSDGEAALASAEIYDPSTGTFAPTGSLSTGRWFHAATLLSDGRVLVVGGIPRHKANGLDSAEVFDPRTGVFSPAGTLSFTTEIPTVTRLPDGRVLVAGMDDDTGDGAVDIWDPTSGAFIPGTRAWPTDLSTATLLPDGTVLVVGGYRETDQIEPVDAACLWDPASSVCAPVGPLASGRFFHTATLLDDGRVLVVGGSVIGPDGVQEVATAELWDPATRTFGPAGSLPEGRSRHTATRLPDGRVLIAGGTTASGPTASVELWDPGTGAFVPGGSLTSPRWSHTATLLDDGSVLIIGGDRGGEALGDGTLDTAEVWTP
jgi:hypothetical protein